MGVFEGALTEGCMTGWWNAARLREPLSGALYGFGCYEGSGQHEERARERLAGCRDSSHKCYRFFPKDAFHSRIQHRSPKLRAESIN